MTSDSSHGTDLRATLSALKASWWLVAICTVLAGGTALALSLGQTEKYTATASLLFRDPAFDQRLFGSTFLGGSTDPDRQAATNLTLVGLREVAERTAARGGTGLSANQVRDTIKVSADKQSDIVNIAATLRDPKAAAALVNSFAREFIAFRRDADRTSILAAQRLIEKQIEELKAAGSTEQDRARSLQDRSEQLSILGSLQTGNAELVQRAEPPDSPSSPRPARNTALGLFLGGILGLLLAMIRGRVDRRLRTVEALEEVFERPVIARIPAIKGAFVGVPETRSRAEEAFNTLWTNLRYYNISRRVDSVLVTSPSRGDGKSTVAFNLAAAAARGGTKVLLLEADLRLPSLDKVSDYSRQPVGLAQSLVGAGEVEELAVTVKASGFGTSAEEQREFVALFAGTTPPNPTELLDSEPMRNLLRDTRARYELVVIDTPPITVIPDAVPLLQQVSAVIVVAKVGTTTRDEATRLKSQLGRLDAPVIGVVANLAPEDESEYYYG